jgi:inorganic pyrophosphatase
MIDKNAADDKIITVMTNDLVYSHFDSVRDVPDPIILRLKHYFLTYKDLPGEERKSVITHIYDKDEALKVINFSIEDYNARFENLGKLQVEEE